MFKRRRRYRRRTYSRFRKRTFRRRRYSSARQYKRNTPEVKYIDICFDDMSVLLCRPTTASTSLFNSQNQIQDVISTITQGVTRSNRIGNSIFVKHISFSLLTFPCSNNTQYLVDALLVRPIVHTCRFGGTVPQFFGDATKYNFNSRPNREIYNCYYDKVHLIQGGVANNNASTIYGLGGSKIIKFKIPLNRKVEFINDTGFVRNERDVISLGVLGTTSAAVNSSSDLKQAACVQAKIRIYFTDS